MNRRSRLISFWAWSGLALAFGFFGLWSFGRAGLLAPEGAADPTRPISLIWMASAGLALLGVILAVLDGVRIRSEHEGAKALVAGRRYGGGPTATWLRREIASGRKDETQLDRAWLETANRRIRTELANVGGSTRAIAGLLMILAVLGTFAGMRDAVPGLAEAVRGVSSDSPAATAITDGDPLSQALDEVSDAFGANLLALFGAVVLGIASIGAASGRSSVFSEMSLAAERAFSDTGVSSVSAALEASVRQMTQSVEAVGGVQQGLDTLSKTLEGFQRDLRHSLEDLGTNVSRTIQVKLEEKLVHTLEANSKNVSSVAQALAATTVAYEGLLEDQQRTRGALDKSVAALENATSGVSERLNSGLASLEQSLGRLDDQIAQQGKAMEVASSSFGGHVADTKAAISEGAQELSRSTRLLQAAVKEVHAAAEGQVEFLGNWAETTGPYARQFLKATTALSETASSVRSSSKEVLERIGTSNQDVRKGMSEVSETITEHLDKAVGAIRAAGEQAANAGRADLDEAHSELKEASRSLQSAVSMFAETVGELTRSREQLLGTPPIRVELSERSIDQIQDRPRRRFLGWFRRS